VPKPPMIDPATVDFSHVVYDLEGIRKFNKQRHEMEQLTAVVHLDREKRFIIAYKDVTADEFWTRGHVPEKPLMPGVVMCEIAAQAASVLIAHCTPHPPDFVGFGGLEEVKFRDAVVPGDRFVVVGQIERLRSQLAIMRAQGFVGTKMVFEGIIIGVPIDLKGSGGTPAGG